MNKNFIYLEIKNTQQPNFQIFLNNYNFSKKQNFIKSKK